MLKLIPIIFLVLICLEVRVSFAGEEENYIPSRAIDLFSDGLIREIAGDYESAYFLYIEADKAFPGNAEIISSIINICITLGKKDKAIERYKELIGLSPANIEYRRELADFAFEISEYILTIEVYNEILKMNPGDSESRIGLAMCFSAMGKPNKAIDELEKGIQLDPNNPELYFNIGEILMDYSYLSKALEYYRIAVEKDSTFADAYFGIAKAYNMLGSSDSMAAPFAKYIKYNREGSTKFSILELVDITDLSRSYGEFKKYLSSKPNDTSTIRLIIQLGFELGDFTGVIVFAEKLLELDNDDWGTRFLYALALHEENRDEESMSQFMVILSQKKTVYIYTTFVDILNNMDSFAIAVKILDEAFAEFPEDTELAFMRGKIYSREGKKDSAKVFFEKAISLAPKNERYRFAYSDALIRCGQNDSAIVILKKLIEEYPEKDMYLNYLGYTLADMNRELPLADSLIKSALAKDKWNAAYIDSYGWLLYRLGKLDSALAELKKAELLSESDDPIMFEHIGIVAEELGNKASAKEYFEKAIGLNPELKTSSERLRRLK